MAIDGLKTVPSRLGPKETMDRLEAEVKAKGFTVFARVDHAAPPSLSRKVSESVRDIVSRTDSDTVRDGWVGRWARSFRMRQ